MKTGYYRLVISLGGLLLSFFEVQIGYAQELSAQEIINKSYAVYAGDDTVSRLTFTIRKKGAGERKLVYTMVWKNYKGRNGLDSKVMFFSEYPLDEQGKSYMGWLYKSEAGKEDEEWLYLPELRMVRKLVHQHHRHKEDDDFSRFELQRPELMPRSPDADAHTLLASEAVDGQDCYMIESVPKQTDAGYDYGKIVKWITKKDFLPLRIDYYDPLGQLQKQENLRWKQVGDAWLWEEVIVENAKTGVRSQLKVSDIHVNNGVSDELFSTRTLMLGRESLGFNK